MNDTAFHLSRHNLPTIDLLRYHIVFLTNDLCFDILDIHSLASVLRIFSDYYQIVTQISKYCCFWMKHFHFKYETEKKIEFESDGEKIMHQHLRRDRFYLRATWEKDSCRLEYLRGQSAICRHSSEIFILVHYLLVYFVLICSPLICHHIVSVCHLI